MGEHLVADLVVLDLGDVWTADAADLLAVMGATIVVDPASEPDGVDAILTDDSTATAILEGARQANAVHVHVTPFGGAGPRSRWRGSDLTVLAATGNLFATGDPDRAPLRCSEPTTTAHTGPEVVLALLAGLAAGPGENVDVSVQELMQSANMARAARFDETGDIGTRRGPRIGRTPETWRCLDGWVVFGLRGGRARAHNWEILERLVRADGLDPAPFAGRDWADFDHDAAGDGELRELEASIAACFSQHTMAELYEIATTENLMLAPVADAELIRANPQLQARGIFGTAVGGAADVPQRPFRVRTHPASDVAALDGAPFWVVDEPGRGPWSGLRLLELGAGAAGPLITRPFVEHGASCIRIESSERPDFLRTHGGRSDLPRLEGSTFFAVLNAGKKSVELDLRSEQGREAFSRLVRTADAVISNFAPGAMERLGLGADDLRAINPRVIVLTSSLYGQTGPHRTYPGFGSQGAALSGYTHLTGWPERAPVGPFGTITDSLAPRFAAAALAAALRQRDRTGVVAEVDVAQVETAVWSLRRWFEAHPPGAETEPRGNQDALAHPHGVFACRGQDRWIAIACWSRGQRLALARSLDLPADSALNEVAIGSRTVLHDPIALAEVLQSEGIDAHAVLDFGQIRHDEQLAARDHFVEVKHPVLGVHLAERSGFRLSSSVLPALGPAPTLGEHSAAVLPLH